MSRQETNDTNNDKEGPRATTLRDALKADIPEQQKFAVWRSGMPEELTDKQVLRLMNMAAVNMQKFSKDSKLKKIKKIAKDKKISEGDTPNWEQGTTSAIPGTPASLRPQPTARDIRRHRREQQSLAKFLGRK